MATDNLSRRERQIMDLLYRSAPVGAAEIRKGLPDPPTYSAVRAMLSTLERKGHVRHAEKGLRYVYSPVVSRDRAMHRAVSHLMDTFFRGSVESAVAALLDARSGKLSREELDRLAKMIERARREGR